MEALSGEWNRARSTCPLKGDKVAVLTGEALRFGGKLLTGRVSSFVVSEPLSLELL